MKDKLPAELRSSLVYEFSCGSCAHRYIGSTNRNLYMRVNEHAGRSVRTGNIVSKPSNSSILDHAFICKTKICLDNFKILDSCNSQNLRILESLYINKFRPELNDTLASAPLLIVK